MAHHLLVVLKYVGFFTISPASMDVCRLDTFRSVPEGVFFVSFAPDSHREVFLLKKCCDFLVNNMAIFVVLIGIVGAVWPQTLQWVGPYVGWLLGIVMFGMGMTMSVHDFALVLKRPKDVFFGACAQYFVMPFLAYVLSTIFQLDPALTVGVVLVGTCPGGTSSNVITFMSKGDVPLSVTMTSVSTLISPIMTPLLTYLIIGQRISFDPVGMFLSILQIVIVPIALGLIVKSFLPKLADTAADYLPAVSALAISFLIAGIIGASRDAILNSSGIILLVVILHNCLGYALGFFIGHLCGMSWKKDIGYFERTGDMVFALERRKVGKKTKQCPVIR